MDEKGKEDGDLSAKQLISNPSPAEGGGDESTDAPAAGAGPEKPSASERPVRTYEELCAALKLGKGVAMSQEEGKLYFAGESAKNKAKKEREEAVSREYDRIVHVIFSNILVKAILWCIYFLWTAIPIVGIVMGLIYVKHESCPGRPSIAPHLIGIGVCALIASITVVSSKAKSNSQNGQANAQPKDPKPNPNPSDETIELGPSTNEIQNQGDPKISPTVKASLITGTVGCCCCCFIVVVKLIHLILFIATSVTVYKFAPIVKYVKLSEEDEEYYCNEIFFKFAFWSLSFSYIIIGLLIVAMLFSCVCYIIILERARKTPVQDRVANNAAPAATSELNC